LHPEKTKIVYCEDDGRRDSYEHVDFTFLGYTFRERTAQTKDGKLFRSFLPAINKQALKRISAEVRSWRLHLRTHLFEAVLARRINPIVRGWMNYYGAFYRSALYPLLERINAYLMWWIRKKIPTTAGPEEGTGRMDPGRHPTTPVLRALGLDDLRPQSLVTRTTRAV